MKARVYWWVFWWGLLVDQVTKFGFEQVEKVIINPGISFGLFPGGGWGLVMVAVLVGVAVEIGRSGREGDKVWLAMILAGGVGNVIDRWYLGGVRDFIYWPIIEVYGNVADIMVVVGAGALIVSQLKMRNDKR